MSPIDFIKHNRTELCTYWLCKMSWFGYELSLKVHELKVWSSVDGAIERCLDRRALTSLAGLVTDEFIVEQTMGPLTVRGLQGGDRGTL